MKAKKEKYLPIIELLKRNFKKSQNYSFKIKFDSKNKSVETDNYSAESKAVILQMIQMEVCHNDNKVLKEISKQIDLDYDKCKEMLSALINMYAIIANEELKAEKIQLN